MDPKLFEQKLTEVAEWHQQRHMGDTANSEGRNDHTGDIPTYPKITKLKDRPCPYNPNHKNCDITIKATAQDGIYMRRCRSCQGVIVRDQWYDGREVKNTARFTEQLLNKTQSNKPRRQPKPEQRTIETEEYIIRINPTESFKL